MAFPSASRNDLTTAWANIKQIASNIKRQAQILHDASEAGLIDATYVTSMSAAIAEAEEKLQQYASTPGLPVYAQEQTGSTVDIVAEYQALASELAASRAWIANNFPKDAGGYLLYHSFNAAGRVVVRQLAPAQTAGLRTQLTALIARIE
jgi:hypothetical protein